MSYHLITVLLWPVFFLYTLKIALRDRSSRYFFQRLGFKYPQHKKHTFWIHCASVGETNTYFPLHLKLLEKYPHTQFVITTNTTTGASTIKKYAATRTTHCYLPIESELAIKRFLKAWQPQRCLIMETEIWPLLYKNCNKSGIPIHIINARLSHRTLNANNWILGIYKRALKNVYIILCKSETELSNFKALGAAADKLKIAGNLKFTSIINEALPEQIDLNHRAYCVAASTHQDEEQQLARLWSTLDTTHLLVIAPRHPNRSDSIQKQLSELGINFSVRSKGERVTEQTRVYLADTLGELNRFMAYADFVFMGGSLIKHGGQNLLEPARFGKAIFCGPHMFNFKDELELLLKHEACIQVTSINELRQVFTECLKQIQQCAETGNRAKAVVEQQSGTLDNYLKLLN